MRRACLVTVAALLGAAALGGCGEPNPGPPGSTGGGTKAQQSVTFPLGPPAKQTAAKAKPRKATSKIDTSQFPPK